MVVFPNLGKFHRTNKGKITRRIFFVPFLTKEKSSLLLAFMRSENKISAKIAGFQTPHPKTFF